MNKIKEEKIIEDHLSEGISFRSLALKYGISYSRAYRIVKSHKSIFKEKAVQESLPEDVAMLKALLRKERLKNELLNNIIDIADKELGANIRKSLAPGSRNKHTTTLAGLTRVMRTAWLQHTSLLSI
ncbi:hypothetical protein [Mucilaginibacter antarcticus]|uniref:hypothetical protein n=1 Tax=Mucilaginibacter antarcticus TaxID=1855725 RepID=UPI003630084F